MALANPEADEVKTGFPKEILNGGNIDPKYLCSLCELVLRAPVQSFCGHRFCEACIKHFLQNASEDQHVMCPSCGKEETENEFSDLKKTFPDNAIKREFANMTAKCINKGCTWEGPFKEYLQHEGACQFQLMKCECEDTMPKCWYDEHRKKECSHRKLICPYCNAQIMAKLMEAHSKVCPLLPKERGRDERTREQMALGEGTSASRPLPVDGASGGISQHQSLERGQPDGEVVHKLKVTDTKVVQFEDTLAIITQQLDSFREEADRLREQHKEMRKTIPEQERKIKSLEKSIQMKDLSLAEADLKIQALEQTTYDGVMTWKITDFAKKRQDAIAGRMSSVYSPPFYTSRTGYKMCARLYLNGDGMGKGTHLSLFFVVMKGRYDALLKWPFRHKVTLMLLDQNNREHVLEAFRPDPNSSSFRRPTSDMNIASGCPLFCQLSQIDLTLPAYLKDDTLFIKIIVDLTEL